ncbi:MAG TPA: aldo/keto reductase [Gemmatimonadales bacterium]|jgi:aryl-alcohol dehydrogenase-like predicted oxidoreductase|nr:aldo/keto reductase [Gemmatimonadales bacterium]
MTTSKTMYIPAAAAGTITLGGDLTVNRMGFGAMRLTGPGIWGPPRDRAQAIRVLQRAVELGVNFFDTADSYGPHVAEELIAEALYPYPGLVIATKAGLERPGPDQWVENGRPEFLRRQLEGSLRRLKLERIDLWQLHRIDPKVPAQEQFEAAREFQREGLVRHVGLSEVSVDDVERARRVLPIVSVQNRYNVTDRKWHHEVDYCEREGMAFIPWFPLSAGSLDAAPLHRIAQRHGATVFQIALAWLLARSPAMLVIPGTSSVDHLEENVAAAEIQLTKKDLAELDNLGTRGAKR